MAIPPPLQRSKAACGRDSDSNADGLADVSRYRHCFTEKKRPKLRCTSPLLFVPERYCCTNIRILASLVSRASSSAMNDEAMQSSSTSDVQVQVAVDPSRKRGVWRLKTQLHQRVKAVPKPVFLGGFVVAVTLMSVAAMARHHLNRLSVALAVPCVSPPPAPSPNATTGLSDEDSSGSSCVLARPSRQGRKGSTPEAELEAANAANAEARIRTTQLEALNAKLEAANERLVQRNEALTTALRDSQLQSVLSVEPKGSNHIDCASNETCTMGCSDGNTYTCPQQQEDTWSPWQYALYFVGMAIVIIILCCVLMVLDMDFSAGLLQKFHKCASRCGPMIRGQMTSFHNGCANVICSSHCRRRHRRRRHRRRHGRRHRRCRRRSRSHRRRHRGTRAARNHARERGEDRRRVWRHVC